jgi:MFS family permease
MTVGGPSGSPVGSTVTTARPPHALAHRPFRSFIIGAFVSNAGTWMQNLAVPYVLYRQTHSAAWVGMAGFATYIPTVLIAPWGGAWAERFQRRVMLLWTQLALTGTAALLWVLWVTGAHNPWAIIAPLALGGVASGANIPAWQAFLTELVPRESLLTGISMNATQFNVSRAFGPALAGVVIRVW